MKPEAVVGHHWGVICHVAGNRGTIPGAGPITRVAAAAVSANHGSAERACGRSSMVERQLPKLHTRVRFTTPAPIRRAINRKKRRSGPVRSARGASLSFRVRPCSDNNVLVEACLLLRDLVRIDHARRGV